MRKQQQIWLEEHTANGMIPKIGTSDPASGVVRFVEFLKSSGVELRGRAVDIGAGKGRNSIYLASCGYNVHAMEYIKPALDTAAQTARTNGLIDKIHMHHCEIDVPWQFEDDFFDIAIDSFSSIDVETKDGRELLRDEMYRTLKPGGYALVTVVSIEDEWEHELIATSPGEEPNSTIWPQNGKFQKDYDEPELREFYKKFAIVRLESVKKPNTLKLNRRYQAVNFWVVLQKTDRQR